MVPDRADDAFAIGFAYTGVSNRVRGFDDNFGEPVLRDDEAMLGGLLYGSRSSPAGRCNRTSVYLPAPGRTTWLASRGRNGPGGAPQYQFLTKDECTIHRIQILRTRRSRAPMKASVRGRHARAWRRRRLPSGRHCRCSSARAANCSSAPTSTRRRKACSRRLPTSPSPSRRGAARRRRDLARLDRRQRLLALLGQHGSSSASSTSRSATASSASSG